MSQISCRAPKSQPIPEDCGKKHVAVCDTQPITVESLETLFAGQAGSRIPKIARFALGGHLVRPRGIPEVIILDKGFGMRAVLDWIHELKLNEASPAVVVWGVSMTEAEVLRLLHAGTRGIIRKTSDLATLLGCSRQRCLWKNVDG